MAGKSSRKPVTRATEKPIIDFFTRKSSLSLSPVQTRMATRSSQTSAAPASQRMGHGVPSAASPSCTVPSLSCRETRLSDHFDASMSLDGASEPTGLRVLSPPRKLDTSKKQQLTLPTNNPKKRTRSPDLRHRVLLPSDRAGTKKTITNRTTSKRKSKFESDSEVEGNLEPVIYITKPLASPTSHKKPRLSFPETPKSISPVEDGLVPSSQSDEQELQPMFNPARDAWAVKESVDAWRKQMTVSPYTIPTRDMDMLVCAPSPMTSVPTSPSSPSAAEIDADLKSTPEPTTPLQDPFTPPLHNLEPLPKTPIVLDAATKTAQIIAQIKARAYAESSPEEISLRDFPEELEESSDEDDEFIILQPQNKRPASSTQHRSLSIRNTSPFVNPEGDVDALPLSIAAGRPRRTRNPSRIPSVLSGEPMKPSNAAKKSSSNPLDNLLKEKIAADKRGKGDEAFRRAESVLDGRNLLLKELQEETGNSHWESEEAARMAVVERGFLDSRISSPSAGDSSIDYSLMLPEVDRLLGQERGKAIEGIIQTDRVNIRDAKPERAPGVPLWSEEGHYIPPGDIPFPDSFGEHRILTSIKSSLEHGDLSQATLLLDSGVLPTIELINHTEVVSFLFQHAVSPQKTLFSESAFRYLINNWALGTSNAANFPFSLILSTVLGLGAVSPALPIGQPLPSNFTLYIPRPEDRADVLYRLIALINSSARSHRLDKRESASILMTLLLIGIEPSTSHELQCEVRATINHICHGIAPGNELVIETESNICTIILAYLTTLEPVDQALAITFFSTGTHRTQRIAQWLAHSIIVNRIRISCELYSDLPPLPELLDELSRCRTSKSESMGKFELHEEANFVNMGFYTQILGIALSNINGYVAQERKIKRVQPLPPPSPSKSSSEKAETLVQIVRSTIHGLFSRISDTRAAHLDRSRTKAGLNALSMRIHYQYMAATKGPSDGAVRPRQSIHQYFRPKN